MYFGRFRRRCLVLEDGHSRARRIPTNHNIPGFTAGIGGTEFLATPSIEGAEDAVRRSVQRASYLRRVRGHRTLSKAQGEREFDVVYMALGCSPQHDLARSLRARDEHVALVVNGHQETSVPRLYAAGDVVRGLNQVVVAAAEGAIAATDIHNKLRAT